MLIGLENVLVISIITLTVVKAQLDSIYQYMGSKKYFDSKKKESSTLNDLLSTTRYFKNVDLDENAKNFDLSFMKSLDSGNSQPELSSLLGTPNNDINLRSDSENQFDLDFLRNLQGLGNLPISSNFFQRLKENDDKKGEFKFLENFQASQFSLENLPKSSKIDMGPTFAHLEHNPATDLDIGFLKDLNNDNALASLMFQEPFQEPSKDSQPEQILTEKIDGCSDG